MAAFEQSNSKRIQSIAFDSGTRPVPTGDWILLRCQTQTDMQITIEKPVSWLESDRDGDRNRLMYATIIQAIHSIGADYTEVDTHYGRDFDERVAPENGILISYHSVGNVRNVWRLKETPVPFFYNLDKLGYSGWSELSVRSHEHLRNVISRDEEEAEAFCKQISTWLVSENLSKYRQGAEEVPVNRGFIFFPMQVRSDVVAIHNRIDPLRALYIAAETCRKNKKLLVVKRHPYCRSKRTAGCVNLVKFLNKWVYTTNASVASLLPACDAVLVGNSGVGFEALVYGKPVYSFARSEYDMATYKINSAKDIVRAFSQEHHVRHPNTFKFIEYFLKERCFDARNLRDAETKLRHLVGIRPPSAPSS